MHHGHLCQKLQAQYIQVQQSGGSMHFIGLEPASRVVVGCLSCLMTVVIRGNDRNIVIGVLLKLTSYNMYQIDCCSRV